MSADGEVTTEEQSCASQVDCERGEEPRQEMRDCLTLLERLMADPRAAPFNEPVLYAGVPELSSYPLVVEKPMDLGTIRGMLLHRMLANAEHFRIHVVLVFDNARLYNRPGSTIYLHAEQLLALLASLWEAMLASWREQMRPEREEKLALQRKLREWEEKTEALRRKIQRAEQAKRPVMRVMVKRPLEPFTWPEKVALCGKMEKLNASEKSHLLHMIYPEADDDEEVELDLAQEGDAVLYRIQRYVNGRLRKRAVERVPTKKRAWK